jgi:hypothetical protein
LENPVDLGKQGNQSLEVDLILRPLGDCERPDLARMKPRSFGFWVEAVPEHHTTDFPVPVAESLRRQPLLKAIDEQLP